LLFHRPLRYRSDTACSGDRSDTACSGERVGYSRGHGDDGKKGDQDGWGSLTALPPEVREEVTDIVMCGPTKCAWCLPKNKKNKKNKKRAAVKVAVLPVVMLCARAPA